MASPLFECGLLTIRIAPSLCCGVVVSGWQKCAARNVHGWTQESLERMLQDWEKTPELMTALSLKVRAGTTDHMYTKHIERRRSTTYGI